MLKNQQRSHVMITKTMSIALALMVGDGAPARAAAAQEVRELLSSARGVAPSMCAMAADGLYSWGGRWQAPAEAVRSDVRTRLRTHTKRRLTSDETAALLEGIASTDACQRHLAATLVGRFGDSTIVGALANRLSAGAPTERQTSLVALGLLKATSQLSAITRALRDETPAVRANA